MHTFHFRQGANFQKMLFFSWISITTPDVRCLIAIGFIVALWIASASQNPPRVYPNDIKWESKDHPRKVIYGNVTNVWFCPTMGDNPKMDQNGGQPFSQTKLVWLELDGTKPQRRATISRHGSRGKLFRYSAKSCWPCPRVLEPSSNCHGWSPWTKLNYQTIQTTFPVSTVWFEILNASWFFRPTSWGKCDWNGWLYCCHLEAGNTRRIQDGCGSNVASAWVDPAMPWASFYIFRCRSLGWTSFAAQRNTRHVESEPARKAHFWNFGSTVGAKPRHSQGLTTEAIYTPRTVWSHFKRACNVHSWGPRYKILGLGRSAWNMNETHWNPTSTEMWSWGHIAKRLVALCNETVVAIPEELLNLGESRTDLKKYCTEGFGYAATLKPHRVLQRFCIT